MVRTRTASSSWVRLSLLLVGASFWAVPVRVRVPIVGPVPAEPRTSVEMCTVPFQSVAGVKLTAARAALTSSTLPDTVQMPVLAL